MDDRRHSPLADLVTSSRPEQLGVRDAGPAVRFVFRGSRAVADAIGPAFGVTLPDTPCRAASAAERHALWLGPDEWLLIGPDGDLPALAASLKQAAGNLPHSLVDVSHRGAALLLDGTRVTEVLNAGCPLDLDAAFPVGMCVRTVFGKAEIVLWRRAPRSFYLEAPRSYLPYVIAFLDEAARA
jgi:sarcosine oxidase subunit gamma